ncbi:putative Cyclin-dependent kinase [Seiridium cardinale]|uniref:Cyclin-dependent kinase n=1 Tax=Seiridium cardinale TaxID=138064 RepID=A0ABR2XG10_9PEZI
MAKPKYRSMSSPLKPQPEAVADKVLKRVEVSKIARKLQGRLALAHFKTKHGWEDLTLDHIEPKIDEVRKNRLPDGDVLSDSSSSTSELPYPTRGLMSSPLKAPLFSDAIGSSNGSTGHRKRTYMASFDMDMVMSSPTKRYRSSPTPHKSFGGQSSLKAHRQLIQSSPIKPRRQQHFTTSTGPDVSFFQGTRRVSVGLISPNFAAPQSDDDDDLLPTHSFQVNRSQASPPSTPPMRNRSLNRRSKEKLADSKEEGADLLLYLAASPSPAVKSKSRMEPPSTPPPRKDMGLPSSMMTTPGGAGGSNLLFPATPGQPFDFSDFVNITPSPAQKPWRTPVALARTPLSVARKRLTFEEPLHGL